MSGTRPTDDNASHTGHMASSPGSRMGWQRISDCPMRRRASVSRTSEPTVHTNQGFVEHVRSYGNDDLVDDRTDSTRSQRGDNWETDWQYPGLCARCHTATGACRGFGGAVYRRRWSCQGISPPP